MLRSKPWIYLNGYPGVGKLTIARELCKLIPNSKIIHNHLIIDLCRSVFERASDEYESLRMAVRQEVLTMISSTEIGRQTTYIFTGAHVVSNPVGPMTATQHKSLADLENVPFISIVIMCQNYEEHMARATSLPRQPSSNSQGKLTDVGTLRDIRQLELFKFNCDNELEVDVSELTEIEAANMIKQYIDSVEGQIHS
ncbi:hypothetical protein BU17DRAFT_38041 [Hysterangium stoloniferum]|nr:hypothetical protein BU17DRAFT_38041 [Hysterangium stoloniferum]